MFVPEIVGAATALLAAIAEWIHSRRVRALAPLAFGPGETPTLLARGAPTIRALAMGGLAWALASLLFIQPKVYQAKTIRDGDHRHVVIVLDVSPSMKLEDAGPGMDQSRSKRAADIMLSFFKRVPMEQVRLSVVATYNGAKPVVVDTRDVTVVRNILADLPLSHAFEAGKTRLFAGLEEAAKLAKDWDRGSTTILVISDGDTVPATGLPEMPPSVRDSVVVGVGDTRAGKFIDGQQSRQDASTLRQIATRMRGTYHDGNQKHLPSDLLREITAVDVEGPLARLGRREYALMTLGLCASLLAFLPLLLGAFGSAWNPGVRANLKPGIAPQAKRPHLTQVASTPLPTQRPTT